MHPVVRPLWMDDLGSVMEIEKESYPFPWTRGIFKECIRAGYSCYGLQLGEALRGYTVFSWGAGECHLLNLCVHPECRSRGFGKMLLEYSIDKARAVGCHTMFLEVRKNNADAAMLYRRRGFEEIGTRPAYYQSWEGREDALVMSLTLVDESTSPSDS